MGGRPRRFLREDLVLLKADGVAADDSCVSCCGLDEFWCRGEDGMEEQLNMRELRIIPHCFESELTKVVDVAADNRWRRQVGHENLSQQVVAVVAVVTMVAAEKRDDGSGDGNVSNGMNIPQRRE